MFSNQGFLAQSVIAAAFGLLTGISQAQTPARPTAPAAAVATSAEKDVPLETSMLDARLFYQLLLGELNVQSNEPGTAFSLILDAARKTNDPAIYERAVNVALQARSGDPALQAARAWKLALPASKDANRYLLQILIGLNRVDESLEPLKLEIAGSTLQGRAIAIAAIPRLYARVTDKKLAASTVELALADVLNSPTLGAAAWTAVGRMRLNAADNGGTLDAASRALALDPKAEGPALLAVSVMDKNVPLAESIVRKFLVGQPTVDVQIGRAHV